MQSILIGSSLWLAAVYAHAGPPTTGTITFSPLAAESVPALGSAMLILLSLLLAFIAFITFRRRQSGIVPVVAGALALASLLSAGGGVSLMQQAHAGKIGSFTLLNPSGETVEIIGGTFNNYANDSGTTLRVGPVVLPPGECPAGALALPDACAEGSNLADGEECEVDCGDM